MAVRHSKVISDYNFAGSLYKSFSINICVIDIYSYGYAGGEMFTFCCTKNLQLVEKCQFRNAKITL